MSDGVKKYLIKEFPNVCVGINKPPSVALRHLPPYREQENLCAKNRSFPYP